MSANLYHLPVAPEGIWSAEFPVPSIGTKVKIKFGGLDTGEVVSYFTEGGYVGVQVKLDKPPDWHQKQNKGKEFEGMSLVFGAEILLVE
jgi:hypothetical protein